MNHIQKITSFSVIAGMFLIAALATSKVNPIAFAQNTSTTINETATQLNQTASKLMQTDDKQHNQLTKHPPIRPQQANQTLRRRTFRIFKRLWKT